MSFQFLATLEPSVLEWQWHPTPFLVNWNNKQGGCNAKARTNAFKSLSRSRCVVTVVNLSLLAPPTSLSLIPKVQKLCCLCNQQVSDLRWKLESMDTDLDERSS
ncbi:hypothetical protein OIU78_005447 [Salix suchowensis]|nr:hypothetical protein OIU78_005447 [Salix suchowensis]